MYTNEQNTKEKIVVRRKGCCDNKSIKMSVLSGFGAALTNRNRILISALTFLQLCLFCNGLPSLNELLVGINDEETNNNGLQNEEPSSSSSYMDHKNLFCGARLSELVTLNVTAR